MIYQKTKLASVLKQPIFNHALMAVVLAGLSSNALSHGYVEAADGGVASARGTLCKYPLDTGEMNTGCGAVQWEPQSVEGAEGFPDSGPADGQIASAGNSSWSELNEQSSDRWVKNYISSGWQTFKWHFTANHVSRDWKYYITKENWNPNFALTRDQFDLDPFCEVDGNYEQPPTDMTHECQVPNREGYHVILAVWDVGDTVNAFYNVIDVEFDGDNVTNTEWSVGGTINPTQDLNVGDKVYTRVFDSSGENDSYSTVLEITSGEQGIAENWSHDLAELINQEQSSIRAGDYDGSSSFEPLYGINSIYLLGSSGLRNVEIGYELSADQDDATTGDDDSGETGDSENTGSSGSSSCATFEQPYAGDPGYSIGDVVIYEGVAYESKHEPNWWSPSSAPTLWSETTCQTEGDDSDSDTGTGSDDSNDNSVDDNAGGDEGSGASCPEFQQPYAGDGGYAVGDRVTFEGQVYISTFGPNWWSPSAAPQYWEQSSCQ
ncbi:lytic polysaccharide monooxygenase [Microbulbifer sp. THAF38]|uniref:lytic polysaccharide monooxygenase n=1 Tax=Microbulbifer sp. THAF38 TaxID=2587856 RepID=UPI0012685F0F|nr:lytic polysaccharide monooxygenase [Microbulbifer sp. THAF38]QFT54371.1 GlcNAc-binding protein A precursor [Microbulbifer sp. THAF38]